VSALPRRGRALPEAFLESVLGGEGRGSRNHFWRVDSPHARGLRCRVVGPARPSAPPRRSSAAFVQGRLQHAGRALLGPHRLLRVGRVLCCGRRPFPRKEGGAERAHVTCCPEGINANLRSRPGLSQQLSQGRDRIDWHLMRPHGDARSARHPREGAPASEVRSGSLAGEQGPQKGSRDCSLTAFRGLLHKRSGGLRAARKAGRVENAGAGPRGRPRSACASCA